MSITKFDLPDDVASKEGGVLFDDIAEALGLGVACFDDRRLLRHWNRTTTLLLGVPEQLLARGQALQSILTYFAERGDYGPGDPKLLASAKLRSIEEGTLAGPYAYYCVRAGHHAAHIRVERTARDALVFRVTDLHAAMPLLDGTADGHVLIDDAQRIVSFSQSAEGIFGWRSDEVLGTPLDLLMPSRHRAAHHAHIKRFAAATLDDLRREIVGLRKSGEEFPAESTITKIGIEGGVVFAAAIRDLSERKRQEEAARRNQVALAQAQHLAKLTRFHWSIAERRMISSDESYYDIMGIALDRRSDSGKAIEPHFHPEDRERVARVYEELEAARRNVDLEYRILRPDGEVRWIHELAEMQLDAEGRPAAYLGTLQDVTTQKLLEEEARRSEQTLRASEQRFRHLVEGSIQGILIHDGNGKPLFANQAFASIYGFDNPEEILKLDTLDHFIPPEDFDQIMAYRQARLRGQQAPMIYEARRLKRDGTMIWLDNRSSVIEWKGQEAIQAIVVDITERKRAEEALRQSEELLSRAFESISDGIAIYDSNDRLTLTNSRYKSLFLQGLPLDPIGKTFEELVRYDLAQGYYADAAGREEQFVQERLAAHRSSGKTFVYKTVNGNWIQARDDHMPDGSIVALRTDVTSLVEAEERFRSLADNLPGVVYRRIMRPDGTMHETYVSTGVRKMLGIEPEAFTTGRVSLLQYVHPEDRQRQIEMLQRSKETLTPVAIESERFIGPGGKARWWQVYAAPRRLSDGSTQFDGIALDITEQRAAAEQLRKVLRLEAIGQLTSGISHDFNNLLGVIIGNLDLAHEVAAGDKRLEELIGAASQSAVHGADLTKRLLAFSRGQPLSPEAVELNEVLPRVVQMLRRTLGEQIAIDFRPGINLWRCFVDPSQIEGIILNLAINARDAMPDGGLLTIKTDNVHFEGAYAEQVAEVEPGDFVLLSVTDTGTGMPKEVLEHVFEPFFTTKETGKGTGLGLSQVYGFVKQSRGHVSIYSEVGLGTTVKIYLPRGDAEPRMAANVPVGEPERGAQETVLIAEDNELLRAVAVQQVSQLGYRTLEASSGAAALDLLDEHPEVRVLFSDVVMPGKMTGFGLAREAKRRYPAIKVLLTSGYAGKALQNSEDQGGQFELLNKPYGKRDLAVKLRQILES